MTEPIDFVVKPGAQRGDSGFLLNRGRHRLAFDSFPGRTIALAFLGSVGDPGTDAALQTLADNRRREEDGKAAFFAVVSETESAKQDALETRFPSVRFLWDGGSLASAFGIDRAWVVLDPMQRVVDVAPLDEFDRVLGRLDRAAPPIKTCGDCTPARFSCLPTFWSPSFAAILSTASSAAAAGKAASCRIWMGGRSSISTMDGSAGAIFRSPTQG
jgi:hypothetical protein